MKLLASLVCCIALLLSTVQAQQKGFTNKQHSISASLPSGWDEVQGIRDNTVLKLARTSKAGQKARITVVLDNIPEGRIAPDFDIWSMSNDELRKAAQDSSMLGETVTVFDTGRGSIDGVHVVWSKTSRPITDGSELWEFVYEGVRGSQYLTIRLTSVGNKAWFISNQTIFAEFIRSLRLKA